MTEPGSIIYNTSTIAPHFVEILSNISTYTKNQDIQKKILTSISSLNSFTSTTYKDKFNFTCIFLNSILLLMKNYNKQYCYTNDSINSQIIRAINIIISNNLLSQTTYTLITDIIVLISPKQVYLFHDILLKLIHEKNIQLENKITVKFFTIIIDELFALSEMKVIERQDLVRERFKLSKSLLEEYCLIHLKYLSDVFLPVIFKKHRNRFFGNNNINLNNNESKLDEGSISQSFTLKVEEFCNKKMQQSFHTIAEAQNENDDTSRNHCNSICKDITNIDEYKDLDIYKNGIVILSRLIGCLKPINKPINKNDKCPSPKLISARSNNNLSNTSNEIYNWPIINVVCKILTKIIKQTQNLFLFMEEYISLIGIDLANSIANIITNSTLSKVQLKKEIILSLSELVLNIMNTYHLSYWIVPLFIENLANLSHIDEQSLLCYEFITKIISSPRLLLDMFRFKEEKWSHLYNHRAKHDNCDYIFCAKQLLEQYNNDYKYKINNNNMICNESILDRIMKLFNNKVIDNAKKNHQFIKIFNKVSESFDHVFNEILNQYHICSTNTKNENIEENKQANIIIMYFYPFVEKILLTLIGLNKDKFMKIYIDRLFNYLKLFSVIGNEEIKIKILDILLNEVKHYKHKENYLYICKQLLSFIENIDLNNSCKIWERIFELIGVIIANLNEDNNDYLLTFDLKHEINYYIQYIEQYIKKFYFDYYDSILTMNDNKEKNKYKRNDNHSKTNELIFSLNESPETLNSTLGMASFIQGKAPPIKIQGTKRKMSAPISSNNDIFKNTINNCYINTCLSFIVPEQENAIDVNNLISQLESFFIEHSPNWNDEFFVEVIISSWIKYVNKLIKSKNITQLKYSLIQILSIISVNVHRIFSFWNKINLCIYEIFLIDEEKESNIKTFAVDTVIIISLFILATFDDKDNEFDEEQNEYDYINMNSSPISPILISNFLNLEREPKPKQKKLNPMNYQKIVIDNLKKYICSNIGMNCKKYTECMFNSLYNMIYHVGYLFNEEAWISLMLIYKEFLSKTNNIINVFYFFGYILDNYKNRINEEIINDICEIFLKGGNKTIINAIVNKMNVNNNIICDNPITINGV